MILARPDLRSIKLELALPAYAIRVQKPESAPILLRDHSHDDPHGTDLADHHAARAYALRIIQELREGGYRPSEATMTVRDELGNTLHSIKL